MGDISAEHALAGKVFDLIPFCTLDKQNDVISQTHQLVDNSKIKQGITNF